MHPSLYLRSLARQLIWPHPRIYRHLEKILNRAKIPEVTTEVVIEGFPRSGNTYAEIMFRLTQGNRFTISHHSHHPVAVLEAIRAKKKTILVLRKPDDAVLSWCSSWGVSDLEGIANVFDIYVNYHKALLPAARDLTIFPFDELTTNFKGLISKLATSWQSALRDDFDENALARQAFQEIDNRIVAEDGKLTEIRVNRPSPAREGARRRNLDLIANPELSDIRKRANRIYWHLKAANQLKSAKTTPSNRYVISVVLEDDFGKGHLQQYHRAIGEACSRNNWYHIIACSEESTLEFNGMLLLPLLKTWSPAPSQSFCKIWQPLYKLLCSMLDTVSITAEAPNAAGIAIFIESFTVRKLLATVCAAAISGRRTELWVLFRYGYEKEDEERLLVQLFCKTFAKLTSNRLRLFSDSHLVADRLQPGLRQSITVLPIPTAGNFYPIQRSKAASDVLRVIWPGSPQPTKGLEVISRLLKAPVPRHLKVIVACKHHPSLKPVQGGPLLESLPNQINHQNHLKLIEKSDAVLLPYDNSSYASRTSGLLVEAILSGTPPFVSGPNWLSSQVNQLGIPELVVDWERNDIWEYIEKCLKNDSIRTRFEEARCLYSRFHCPENFARVLEIGTRD